MLDKLLHALFHCLVITLVCDAAGGQAAERGSMLKRRGRVGGKEGGREEGGLACEHRGLEWREGKGVESRVGQA